MICTIFSRPLPPPLHLRWQRWAKYWPFRGIIDCRRFLRAGRRSHSSSRLLFWFQSFVNLVTHLVVSWVKTTLLVEHGMSYLATSRTLMIERSVAFLRVMCARANTTLRRSTAAHLFVALLVAVVAQVGVVQPQKFAAERPRCSENCGPTLQQMICCNLVPEPDHQRPYSLLQVTFAQPI